MRPLGWRPAFPVAGANDMLRVIVLGAAAGGGLPQWNCGCANCIDARDGKLAAHTQASLAVSADDDNWFLINAAPDLRHQLIETSRLHPKHLRHSPIAGVILTNAEIDAVAGLLSMREGSPFALYAHPQVLAVLQSNSIFNVLNASQVDRIAIDVAKMFTPRNADGMPAGFDVTPFAVAGKEALYLEGAARADEGDTLGLTLRDHASGKTAHIVTACARITDDLIARLDGADAIFFDGTLWRDDELISLGLGQKTGARMGHVAMDGPEGAIARLATVNAKRKVFVHINNSNPVWRKDSIARAAITRAGWEIGHDGMEIVL